MALTLTLISMRGCSAICSDWGALGFSNEKSLTYWVRMLTCGWAVSTPLVGASAGALPGSLAMASSFTVEGHGMASG